MKTSSKISVIVYALILLVGITEIKEASQKPKEVSAETEVFEVVEQADLVLTQREIKIEVNEELDPHSLIVSGTYDELIYPVIDNQTVGTQTLIYKAIKGQSEVKKTITIHVIDTIGPVITGESELELRFDSDFDILSIFSAVDEIDGDVDVYIDGDVDRLTAGDYNILIKAKDLSENETSMDVLVTVLEDPVVVARNQRNEEYKGLVSEATNLNNQLLANTTVANIEAMLGRVNNAKGLDSDYQDQLSNLANELSAKLIRAKDYYTPVIQAPTTSTPSTNAPTTSTPPVSGEGVSVFLTRYGYDCVGCVITNGIAYTSLGIGVTTNSVQQPDGSWQQGIKYNGRYLFAGNYARTRCTLFTLYDHPYAGMGIEQGVPIYGVMGDNGGGLSYNHFDLFVGTETNLDVVYVANYNAKPYVVITGFGTYTGSGCSF